MRLTEADGATQEAGFRDRVKHMEGSDQLFVKMTMYGDE